MWCVIDKETVIDYETGIKEKLEHVKGDRSKLLGYAVAPAQSSLPSNVLISKYEADKCYGVGIPYGQSDYLFAKHVKVSKLQRWDSSWGAPPDITTFDWYYIGGGMLNSHDYSVFITLLDFVGKYGIPKNGALRVMQETFGDSNKYVMEIKIDSSKEAMLLATKASVLRGTHVVRKG